jgi:hypothetical protein
MYKNTISVLPLCGCTEGRTRLGAFERKVLRRIFAPEKETEGAGMPGGWTELHESFRNLHCSLCAVMERDRA